MNNINLRFIIYIFIFAAVLAGLHYYIEEKYFVKNARAHALVHGAKKLAQREDQFNTFLNVVQKQLVHISQTPSFDAFMKNPEKRDGIEEFFLLYAQTHANIMQMRIIDAEGNELLRVEKKSSGGTAIVQTDLQNKADRDYFQRAMISPLNKPLFSRIDLNKEHGEIETPHVPTLRSYIPLEKEGHFNGIFIVNYFMQDLLDEISNEVLYDVILFDDNGYTIFHHQKGKSFGNILSHRSNVKDEYPDLLANMSRQNRFMTDTFAMRHFENDLPNGLNMMIQLNEMHILEEKKNLFMQYVTVSIMIFIVGSLLLWALWLPLIRLQNRLKKASDEAMAATKAKSLFLANMSHEIRTPLNGLMGFLYHLMQEDVNEEQREMLFKAEHASKALLTVINDILDFSKIEAGQLQIQKKYFHVKSFLANLESFVSYQAKDKGIEFHIETDDETPPFLYGDEFRLTQIMTNLLSNAFKFTSKGEVVLSFKPSHIDEENKMVTMNLSVRDTGIGIDTIKQDKLFEAFYQGDFSRTKRYGGVGLGLCIVKQLVNLMEGKISINSFEGIGTTVQCSLPMLFSRENMNEKEGKYLDKTYLFDKSKKILIAEDNQTNQLVAELLFRDLGMNIEIANDGIEAVEMASKKQYDLIFMDIHMPNLNGYDAAVKIRKVSPLTPIYALSAAVMSDEIEQAMHAGMNGFITKPIDVNEIKKVLSELFPIGS